MDYKKEQRTGWATVWELAERQHGLVARRQILDLGLHGQAITHRQATGRLYQAGWGVYAVGRPGLTTHGRWMAAVLACGPDTVLSHETAAALWEIRPLRGRNIDVSVPARRRIRHKPWIRVHRRAALTDSDFRARDGIPVTSPICTLIDVATRLRPAQLERAISEADKFDLANPEELRRALDEVPRRPGIRVLRDTLDRHTFTLTDSELERRFLPLALRAGLSLPQTRCYVNGFRVDFYWPDLGLVVETDGLRYHRTPAQQARDRIRDQSHAAAGLTTLRFTRAQVRFEPDHVCATLAAVARRLSPAFDGGPSS